MLRMLVGELFAGDAHGPAIEKLGLVRPPQVVTHGTQRVERPGNVGVDQTKLGFLKPERPTQGLLGALNVIDRDRALAPPSAFRSTSSSRSAITGPS